MRSQLRNALGGASASSDGASSSTGVREAHDSTVKLVIAGKTSDEQKRDATDCWRVVENERRACSRREAFGCS